MNNLTFGGLNDSLAFHRHKVFETCSNFPIISSISGPIRAICAVALAVFNTLKFLVFATIGVGQIIFGVKGNAIEVAGDSLVAVPVNLLMVLMGIYEAIPIIGNIKGWSGFKL